MRLADASVDPTDARKFSVEPGRDDVRSEAVTAPLSRAQSAQAGKVTK
jgi:hypothetical protein